MLKPAPRRASAAVRIGPVRVGGGAPIVVQSMTDTDTADVAGTVAQVEALARAGSELVRITVNTPEAARAVPAIRERLDALGCRVPLIGDFHYNGTGCSPRCASAPKRWPSTASTPATSASARSATPASRR